MHYQNLHKASRVLRIHISCLFAWAAGISETSEVFFRAFVQGERRNVQDHRFGPNSVMSFSVCLSARDTCSTCYLHREGWEHRILNPMLLINSYRGRAVVCEIDWSFCGGGYACWTRANICNAARVAAIDVTLTTSRSEKFCGKHVKRRLILKANSREELCCILIAAQSWLSIGYIFFRSLHGTISSSPFVKNQI